MTTELLALTATTLALTFTFSATRTLAVCLTSSFTRVSSRAATWFTATMDLARIGLIVCLLEGIFRLSQ